MTATQQVTIRVNGQHVQRQICCENLGLAFTSGTDNESYGALARAYSDDPTDIHVGCDLPTIKFCPWCGTRTADLKWNAS